MNPTTALRIGNSARTGLAPAARRYSKIVGDSLSKAGEALQGVTDMRPASQRLEGVAKECLPDLSKHCDQLRTAIRDAQHEGRPAGALIRELMGTRSLIRVFCDGPRAMEMFRNDGDGLVLDDAQTLDGIRRDIENFNATAKQDVRVAHAALLTQKDRDELGLAVDRQEARDADAVAIHWGCQPLTLTEYGAIRLQTSSTHGFFNAVNGIRDCETWMRAEPETSAQLQPLATAMKPIVDTVEGAARQLAQRPKFCVRDVELYRGVVDDPLTREIAAGQCLPVDRLTSWTLFKGCSYAEREDSDRPQRLSLKFDDGAAPAVKVGSFHDCHTLGDGAGQGECWVQPGHYLVVESVSDDVIRFTLCRR